MLKIKYQKSHKGTSINYIRYLCLAEGGGVQLKPQFGSTAGGCKKILHNIRIQKQKKRRE